MTDASVDGKKSAGKEKTKENAENLFIIDRYHSTVEKSSEKVL